MGLDATRAPAMTEAEWQANVVELAGLLGWSWMHVRRSIGKGHRWTTATNVKGWPDLTLYRPAPDGSGELIFAELKTETGKVDDDQVVVHDQLRRAGQEVFVWRPSDLDLVKTRLSSWRTSRPRTSSGFASPLRGPTS